MYAVYLGQSVVSGGSAIDIYIDDLTNGSLGQRTWYDGVAYTRMGNLNAAPVFTADPIVGADATENVAYVGSLAGSATDAEGDPLAYAKVSGPDWLFIATDGTLSGTPTGFDVGVNIFTVSVSDGLATPVEAALNITVIAATPNDFSNWMSGYSVGTEIGFTEDPDNDGIRNGLESYFGTHPGELSVGMQGVPVYADADTFTFSHPLNDNLPSDITVRYRWSKNLTGYQYDGETDGASTVTFQQGTPSGGIVNVTATVTGTSTDKLFIIIEVTKN